MQSNDELPFLVTHWLSSVTVSDSFAQERIQRAARELSEAFAAVGGFGPTALTSSSSLQSASFSQARLQRACPPQQLSHLVQSARLLEETGQASVNLLEQAAEQQRQSREGRTTGSIQQAEQVVEVVTGPFQVPEHPKAQQIQTAAESGMKAYLDLRDKIKGDEKQIVTMQQSVTFQTNTLRRLEQNPCSDDVEQEEKRKACERVLSQLERPLQQLMATQQTDRIRLQELKCTAEKAFQQFQHVHRNFQTPSKPSSLFSRILRRAWSKRDDSFSKILLQHRLDHAATINTHLSYPVYCLQFDKTGRYFCTGADDYLVRVFCVDPTLHPNVPENSYSKIRGAFLVCTLRGHAGVINNIDVSPDNAFLATASEDGDCRVWGLVDGSPVAILRGHAGGTNTVIWTSPYRLVTAGSDGWARCWDIRQAALKRYGKWVGKRLEYHQSNEKTATNTDESKAGIMLRAPLQDTQGQGAIQAAPDQLLESSENTQVALAQIPLPPLPEGNGLNVLENNHANANEESTGDFVFNDNLDEGVDLLCKLPHGNQSEGRTRSSFIKVLCVAKCPFGLHFATGSDDGTCRIWKETADPALELIENKSPVIRASSNLRDQGELLLELKAHHSAITDLSYSYKGDRLLSASQKEGVVRVWSWSVDPSYPRLLANRKTSHILIQLSNPRRSESAPARRRAPAASRISCDVACWTAQDETIITSQSELEKLSGSAIVPGSQFICVWDSRSGNCLVAISGGHSMQCPVLVPHPSESDIFCSAGADGRVKVWNVTIGECVFQHKNTLEFGPIDARDKGKPSGYLDGSFSPDGALLVLTDDSGRVSIFDSVGQKDETDGKNLPWMKEQYFSNDYYDLLYDQNGYCVERGSEQPPHLAPRGVRCSNAGTPWAAFVNDLLRGNTGPLPSSEVEARCGRQYWRQIAAEMSETEMPVHGNVIARLDPETTVMIGEDTDGGKLTLGFNSAISDAETRPRSPRRMSDNYRWRDYTDILREEASSNRHDDDSEMADTDDEEFEYNETAGRRLHESSDSDNDDDMEDSLVMPDSPAAGGRPRRRRFIDDDDSDSEVGLEEYMSTNNEPSGPFIRDYDSHFFRVPDARSVSISRSWVRRLESNSSYGGRKSYTPQVGDSIVYIPRVHKDTILQFPSLTAPWRNWPDGAEWPFVQCVIRNIRYRFPFTAYSGRGSISRCNSVVAILSLEITGVAQISRDRRFRWPSPEFAQPEQSHLFELNLFENSEADYIYPSGLFQSRLARLEEAIASGRENIEIEVYYKDESRRDDSEWTPFPGRIVAVTESDDDGELQIEGSGYRSVSILWNTGERENVSPWELSLCDDSTLSPDRPALTEMEKKKVRDAIGTVKDMEMGPAFADPVNEHQFSDYQSRVEVPMCLNFMLERLESNYYCSLFSVVADVKLIKENCIKYNGEVHDLSDAARKMLSQFEEMLLPSSELEAYRTFQAEIPNIPPAAGEPIAETATLAVTDARRTARGLATSGEAASLRTAPVRRASSRQRSRSTSLEALPPPRHARTASNQNGVSDSLLDGGTNRRQSRRIRIRTGDTQRTLEDLASGLARRGGRAQNRGGTHRTLRASSQPMRQSRRVLEAIQHQPDRNGIPTRQSRARAQPNSQHGRFGRPGRRQLSYADQPSDIDLSDNDENAIPSNVRRNRDAQRSSSARVERQRRQSNASEAVGSSHRSTRSRDGHVSYAEQPSDIDISDHDASTNFSSSRVARPHSSRSEQRVRISDVSHEDGQSSTRSARLARRALSRNGDVDAQELTSQTRNTRRPLRSSIGSHHGGNDGADPGNAFKAHGGHASDDSDSSQSKAHSSARASGRKRKAKDSSDEEDFVDDDAQDSEVEEDTDNESDESNSVMRPSRKNSNLARAAKSYESGSEGSDGSEFGLKTRKVVRKATLRKSEAVEEVASTRRSTRSKDRYTVEESPGSEERKRPSKKSRRGDDTSDEETPPPPKKARRIIKNLGKNVNTKQTNSVADPWPEIDLKCISQVSLGILERLRVFDEEKLFEEPVVEQYPDIADSYQSVIKEPMDFRTIEEERLPRYRSIQDLQRDLMLVFNNCILFNQEQLPEYANKARQMKDMLKDIFMSLCQELDILRPRRRK
ncbi:bromodomain and WD repeat domain containing protein 1/3 [Fistulifera solaris]|uniref:Bromodomain and WD repeat domain containing protein 1/3 n=1 Tax=Fistulifera solaris TaxID=1519565 RepID=A0A1Z5J981_FISSO|nr:bromodomain and WD repeat domain containing protein 1/3 [Fistulifera solaris]|eukprot:GAX10550.1 bromodomain and WD repeat domain containing protein 1/3 [Fistulifera solaris]